MAHAIKDLPTALGAANRERLAVVIGEIQQRYRIVPVELPEAGLYLLQLEDAVMKERFHLGEIPGSRAIVRLSTADYADETWEGGAVVMEDDENLAQQLAIADAVLRHELEGSAELRALLEEGRRHLAKEQGLRDEILRRTRVDFSLLDEAED